jgi:hypothetical protein
VRLGDRDRELLFEALKHHSAAGRLDVEELERRVERLTEAQTTEQAAEVLADLPPLVPAGAGERAGRPRWGRGHGEADTPAPDWRPTNERFRDPRTNRVMRVWLDAAGGRHYVVDEAT